MKLPIETCHNFYFFEIVPPKGEQKDHSDVSNIPEMCQVYLHLLQFRKLLKFHQLPLVPEEGK